MRVKSSSEVTNFLALDKRINTYEKATYFEKAIVFLGIEKY